MTRKYADGAPLLRFHQVTKAYGDFQVIRGVSLEVYRGETVCLIGPSGSGKSTLLRCANLLESVNGGAIFFNGRDITCAAKPAEVRRRMGMVFQNFELFPHMTALENVAVGPVTVGKVAKHEAEKNARALLSRVELADKETSYPNELSGGQQQRVAIARALAMNPEVILFDEPTSALDPETVGEVLGVMQSLAEEHVTMVVVTHEMSFALRAADWLAILDHGELVEEGLPADIFERSQNERTRNFLRHIHNPSFKAER